MAKVMISLPDAMLRELDVHASERGQTRSGVIQQAVRRELGRPDASRFDATLARARAAVRAGEGFDAATLVREVRDTRADRPL